MISITEKQFRLLVDYVKKNFGINLAEKRALLEGRLHNVLLKNNYANFQSYYEYLVADKTGTAVTELLNRLTTNHTFFLREEDHFWYLRDEVLPFLKNKVRERDLRIWSAGCSTGEEPYTLAMILADFFGPEKALWDTKILATDISQKVLDKAKTGIYEKEELTKLPKVWQKQYFQSYDEAHRQVGEGIRQEVIFKTFNLNSSIFPFKKRFQVIFCRNVMIYFDPQTKRALVDSFYEIMEEGGYLFIGLSEFIGREETQFKYIRPAVYRKVWGKGVR